MPNNGFIGGSFWGQNHKGSVYNHFRNSNLSLDDTVG